MAHRKGPTVRCLKCGKGFHVPPVRAATAKYCSRACKYADREAATKITKICRVCEKEFQTWQAQDNDFCSYRCAFDARVRKVKKLCAYCGKEFWVKRAESETLCCSWGCRVARLHSRMSRRSNPKYWKKVRLRILNRDGWTCQKCHLVSFNGKLHVHHVIHRKNGGTEDDDNLITLCNPCHRAEHRQRRYSETIH